MVGAVGNKGIRTGRRKALIVLLIAAGLALAANTLEFDRGPVMCSECRIETPVPDAATRGAILAARTMIERLPMFPWATDTTYLICNATHCAKYHQNFERNWVSEDRQERQGDTPSPSVAGTGDSSRSNP